jgi:asparagine synthase (glutamine-hydrolysing)
MTPLLVETPASQRMSSMSPLEIAAGQPFGFERGGRLPVSSEGPMAVLEAVCLESLRHPPCYVAFSGGRDSSLVLAAAAQAAKREGCPPPIALTFRVRDDARADERSWQELVLRHVGVEQTVVEITDELDLVGEVAAPELLRRGALFPPNVHVVTFLAAYSGGGSLLLGVGGDQLLGDFRWEQLNDLLARRRSPAWRDVRRLGGGILPARVRGALLERRKPVPRPWLLPEAAAAVRRADREFLAEPVRFDRSVARALRHRGFLMGCANLVEVGASAGVRVVSPLADPRFVAALARAGGARGWGDRERTMRAIAGDALPDALLGRRSKAAFNDAFFGDASRRFAREWSGEGFDPTLVDPEALRRAWLDMDRQFGPALLLQIAWLHDHGHEQEG